jgi:N-methylhydantoinase A/oxoprolinase/acetone carboxylase beta subunit
VAHEIATAFPRPLAFLNPNELTAALRELDERCGALMSLEGITDAQIIHFADVCYIGQSYHLQVPLQGVDAAAIYDAFLAAHAQFYGHSSNVPAKIVNLRTVHQAFSGTVAMQPAIAPSTRPPGARTIRVASGTVQATIWQRGAVTPDKIVPGPAIVEQSDTTTLVEPGWTARLTSGDALLLERCA